MSPTILRVEGYRFFFNSREETRRHVHIQTSDGVAKFWLEPAIEIASQHNISPKSLKRIERLVRAHEEEFKDAWSKHFGQ